jgi:hypothetical protein
VVIGMAGKVSSRESRFDLTAMCRALGGGWRAESK